MMDNIARDKIRPCGQYMSLFLKKKNTWSVSSVWVSKMLEKLKLSALIIGMSITTSDKYRKEV